MGSRLKRGAIFASFAFLMLLAGSLYYVVTSGSDDTTNAYKKPENMPDDEISAAAVEQTAVPPSPDRQSDNLKIKFNNIGVSLEDQLVKELKKYYGATISQKSTQASLYELRKSIAGCSPDGLRFFYNVIKRAFPEYAKQIMDTLDKLDLYHQWLAENTSMLSQMAEDTRLATLWKKRVEMFGEAAYAIWTEDMLATNVRKREMRQTLDKISASEDMAIERKLDLYKNKLREVYEDTPEAYLLSQTSVLSKIFFSIDSVQDELKQMKPEQRQMKINAIRRDMGFSQQQVEKMAELDAKRNKKWKIGIEYMKEREKLASTYEGGVLKDKLDQLRKKYFKDEAETIALEEEKDNFFRFKRPRYYGRN